MIKNRTLEEKMFVPDDLFIYLTYTLVYVYR